MLSARHRRVVSIVEDLKIKRLELLKYNCKAANINEESDRFLILTKDTILKVAYRDYQFIRHNMKILIIHLMVKG